MLAFFRYLLLNTQEVGHFVYMVKDHDGENDKNGDHQRFPPLSQINFEKLLLREVTTVPVLVDRPAVIQHHYGYYNNKNGLKKIVKRMRMFLLCDPE